MLVRVFTLIAKDRNSHHNGGKLLFSQHKGKVFVTIHTGLVATTESFDIEGGQDVVFVWRYLAGVVDMLFPDVFEYFIEDSLGVKTKIEGEA